MLEFLLPPQDGKTIIEVGEVDKEISFEDFERSLLKGEVSAVRMDALSGYAVVFLTSSYKRKGAVYVVMSFGQMTRREVSPSGLLQSIAGCRYS